MTAMRLHRYPSPSGGIALGKMGVGATMMRSILPAGARWVEYLESTGTQWIDTGILAMANTNISIRFAVTDNVVQGIFGRRVSALNNSMLVLQYLSGGGKWFFRWDRGSGSYNMSVSVLEHVYSGVSSGSNFALDGTIYYGNSLNTSGTSLYLFAINQGESPILLASALQTYGCRITEGDTLVRDFHPIAIGTTGYMLDLVSGAYLPYGNQGTGDFVIGPDINAPAI